MDVGGETGAAVKPRRPARRPGFMAEIALGFAGAVVSAPELMAVVLLAATLGLRDIAMCVGVAHLAGLVLARTKPDRGLLVVSAWIGITAIAWFATGGSSGHDGYASQHLAIRIVATMVAVAWAAGSRRIWILAIVVAVAAEVVVWDEIAGDWGVVGTTVVRFGLTARVLRVLLAAGFAAATFVLVAIGRRGWVIAAIATAVVVTVAPFWFSGVIAAVGRSPGFLAWSVVSAGCGLVVVLVPFVCGMAARAVNLGAAPDDGARLLTTFARRPWMSALAAGVVLFSLCGNAAFLGGGTDAAARIALLGRIASASALLAMLASGAAGSLGALAPLFVASAFAFCAWCLSSVFGSDSLEDDTAAGRAVRSAAYLLPQIVARALLARVLDLRRFTMPLVAVAFLVPQIAVSEGIAASPWVGLAWVVVVAAACVAVATGDAPAAQIVAAAVVLGLVQRLAIGLLAARVHVELTAASWFELPTAWMLAAVFALIARRARTMTAVPVDHPMFVDFAPAA